MSTENENSQNNLYIFEPSTDETPGNRFSRKITYRKNLVEEIKKACNGKLDDFPSDNVTDQKFREFISRAEKEGYTIYKLIKL